MSALTPFDYWQKRRRHIRTSIGQWHPGKGVTSRGRSMLGELIHELSETQLLLFHLTGRLVDENLAKWLEKSRFLTAYPDPRIWCNQIASLVACQGVSPVTGGALSFLAADSRAYGSYLNSLVVDTLSGLYQQYQSTPDFSVLLEGIPKHQGGPAIPGFLRPIRVYDERLEPMRKVSRELGFVPGPYQQFAEALSDYLEQQFSCGMNIAGYCCSFLMDQGFNAQQIYAIALRCVESGAMACFQDCINEKEGGFLPLQCEDIEYIGPSARCLSDEVL